MKTIILSLFLSVMGMFGFAQAYQVTVSGTVTDATSGAPIGGIAVTIETDSTEGGGGYSNVVFTNANGYYSDVINAADGEAGTLFTSIVDCDSSLQQVNNQYDINNNTFQVDFMYCGNPGGGGTSCMAMYLYYSSDVPLQIQFQDISFGNPTSWDWEFGDGNTSTEQNPIHIFDAEGEYQVTLTISSDSCSSSYTDLVWVYTDSTGFDQCQAMFWAYPDQNDIMTYNFLDNSWTADGGTPDTWAWDFGDGATSTDENPVHTYSQEGDYQVCLTITDSANDCEDTYCQDIYVYNDTTNNCYGYFTYEVDDSSELILNFQALNYCNCAMDYTWDFGDGNTGTGETVSHTFLDGGIYFVTLTATGIDSVSYGWTYSDVVWVGSNWTVNLSGVVHIDSNANADAGYVYLMVFDTTGNGLVNIDTAEIDANGYYEFETDPFQYCIYFAQAELSDQSIYFGQFAPTYYVSSLSWEEAWPIFPFCPFISYDIYMIPQGTTNSGDGTVEGMVTTQGDRGAVNGVEMLLMDVNENPLSYIRSSENGSFDFSDIAFGTYKLRVEYVGVTSQTATITLTADNPTATVNVSLKDGEAFLGMEEISSVFLKDFGNIYPNPVTSNASVNITMKQASKVIITITNQVGQVVKTDNESLKSGANRINLHISSLPQGVYIIKVLSRDGAMATRKMIKIN